MKNSIFYKIYFSVIAVFCLSLIAGLFWFGGFLSDFEANQPDNIAAKTVEENIKTNGIRNLEKNYNLALSGYETDETVNLFYDEYFKDKNISFSRLSFVPDNFEIGYTVLADGQRILDIFLSRNQKGKYFVAETKINQSLLKSYIIKTDEQTEISVNGIPVKAEDRKNIEPTEAVKAFIGDGAIINKQTIKLENLLYDPTVLATQGAEKKELAADNNTFVSEQNFPEKQKIEQLVFGGTSAYAAYIFNLVPISDVAAHFDTSSEFYKNLRSTDVHYTLEYVKNEVTEFKINDMHKFNDTLFCCHVTFTNVLTRRGKEHKDYFNKLVYVKSFGGNYKIVDMQNAE